MKTKGFFIQGVEQWSQLTKRCNWYTFEPIKVSFEKANYSGRYELEVIILGLGFNLQYVYDDSFNKKMQERIRRVESGEEKTYTVDEVFEELRKGL